MTKAWLNRFWQLGVVSSLITGSAIASSENYVFAQIQPDSTLKDETSVVNSVDENSDRIDGGAIRSNNLLHSFQEFNVGEGKAVYFANPQGIENIFSRVTGNNPSQIQGVLGVLGNANLFLLNPNGIIFGENASLDVNGSFVATTANAVQFGSQGIFSTASSETPSLLTVNPSALLFNQINQTAAIVNNSQVPAGKDPGGINVFGLRVPNGKSLLLVGGNVSMDGGWAIASGGRIELGGLTEAGSIGIQNNGSNFSLSFPEGIQRGDISLTNNAIVGVIADGGGSIAANARNLDILAGSEFFAGIGEGLGTASTQAGDITVGATGQIKLSGVDSLIFNSVQSGAVGNAGNITIKTGSLSVTDGGQINSFTLGQGNAGDITIQATDRVTFDGVGSNGLPSASFSDVQPGAVGDGGNINIIAGSLSLTNGAELGISIRQASDTLLGGQGKGGTVNVDVRDALTISGTDSGIFGDIGSGAVGSGGDINIQAKDIFVTDSGLIRSSTFGKGDSGNISITADNAISLDQADVVNNVQSSEAEGNAGKIDITTGSLSATNGSQINSFTRGQGNAGDITIQATDAVIFDGVGSNGNYSSLSSSVQAGANGDGGNINVTARSLSLTNGGELNVSVREASDSLPGGKGKGGSVNINVDDALTIAAGNAPGIFANLGDGAEGSSGDIAIQAGNLVVNNGGQINSFTSGQGNAGDITIQARDAVTVDSIGSNGISSVVSTGVDAGAIGNGGNVNIMTGSLSLKNGSQINSFTRGQGNGGDITIQATDAVTFDGIDSNGFFSGVAAGVDAGAVGDSGNVNITAGSLSLTNGGVLDVDVSRKTDMLPGGRGKGGTVNIHVRDALTISGSDSQISSSLRSGAVGRGEEIEIQAGNVFLKDGGQIAAFTDGKGNSGNIFITARDTISLDRSIIANLVLSSEAEGNAGKIDITTDSFSLTNGSQITSLTRGQGNAGDINIQAKDAVTLDGFQLLDDASSISYTGLFSSVDPGAVGNGGNINITAGSLSLTNSGQLNASISEASDSLPGGKGQGGSININVDDALTIANVDDALTIAGAKASGIFTSLGAGAVGSSGDIDIQAGNLVVKDSGEINSSTFGQGDSGNISITADNTIFLDASSYIVNNVQSSEAVGNAGKIDITTGSLSVTNGSQINSFTRGQGNAGDITIQAIDKVTFDGVDSNGFPSGLNTSVEAGANGDGGTINITAGAFFLTNLAKIFSTVDGSGNGGGILIEAQDIASLVGIGDVNLGRNAFINTADGSIISSSVNFGGEGEGGDITINAGSLRLDSSQINTSTAGKGASGDIIINARDSVDLLQGSDMFAEVTCACEEHGGGVGGIGDGGDIKITTGSLLLDIGASLRADTEARGNGGNIIINAWDSVTFRSDISTLSGGALTQVEPEAFGRGGDIKITTGTLSLAGYQEINTRTQGQGNAGNIDIEANSIVLTGSEVGIFSGASQEDRLPGTLGNGGDINVTAGSLFINDEAKISANTEIIGTAGDITVNADRITLNNGSSISSESVAGDELIPSSDGLGKAGDINIIVRETLEANNSEISTSSSQSSGGAIAINARKIRLRGDSDIRTNVASGAGSGGDITLTADSIIAFNDSDILAFAQDGAGGNITFNTPAFFSSPPFRPAPTGTNPFSLDGNNRVDINATGAVSGAVTVPDVSFIQNSLTELPENPIDTNALIANSCIARRDRGGTFTVTGAGGLPSRPGDAAVSPYPTGDVRGVESENTSNNSTHRPWKIGDPIVEPQTAYRLADGQMVLSRECER